MSKYRVLSLGAGLQSSTLGLMSAVGEIEMPDFAVFADTGAEPAAVYQYLDWLETQLPFEVMHVSAGFLSEAATHVFTSERGTRYTKHAVPAFTKNPNGTQGRHERHCTGDFKVAAIRRAIRKRIGTGKNKRAEVLIGISMDEITRVKPSKVSWIEHVYPLLVGKRMHRHDCVLWLQRHGFPVPPRSACVFCPNHGNDEWRELKEASPREFARAVEFERRYQAACAQSDSLDGIPYLHRSLVPLDQADFSAPSWGWDLFGEICEAEAACAL